MASIQIDFLAGLAHELRTPLSAIGGYAELLELGVHGPVTPAQMDGLQRIRRNQLLMVSLISSFMSYAEVATDSIALSPEAIGLRDALGTALDDVAERAAERSVRIDGAWASALGRLTVHADAYALATVLAELLRDAVESSTPGEEVHIDIESTTELVSLRFVSIGEPIPADALEAVFVPFSREGKGSRASASPHALSLPIARALSRALGGDVTASSSPLMRSLVLTLPLHG